MRKIAWSLLAASAVVWAACAAWGRPTVDYNEVTAESLVTSPQASWARAILFTDEVVAPPAGNWKRLDRKNYAEMRLQTVGAVWIPEGKLAAFEGLQPGRLYSFGGTVDQFSRRYYVIVDAVFELQTGDDLSAHWTGMLDGGTGEDDPALQGVLLQVQNRLIQMAKEQGVTVAQLVEAQTDGGQRLAQVVAAEAMQNEFKAKNTTAEEVLIDSVLALLQKQVVMEGEGAGAEALPDMAPEDAPAAGLSMEEWDGEVQAADVPEAVVPVDVAETSGMASVPGEPATDAAGAELDEMAAAVPGEPEEEWWEGIEEMATEAGGEEIESMGDILAGLESMGEPGDALPADDASAEAALDGVGGAVPELAEEIPFDAESAPEADVPAADDFPLVPEAYEGAWTEPDGMFPVEEPTPEAEAPALPEMDGFETVAMPDGVPEDVAGGGDGGQDVPPVTDEVAENPPIEFGEEPWAEPAEEPVADAPEMPEAPVEAEPVVAGERVDGRIVPLGGGALTPRVSLEPTRDELESAAREAEEQARAAEEAARRAEKEAREEAKRQEKERKEAEAEARRLEKEAARAAEARAKEEEEARRAAEKALAKRLKEEAKAAERDQEALREALEAQQAAAVEAARAAERLKKAEAAALAEREAHAAQMKDAEARRAAAAAALEAAEREKAAALARIEAESEAAYAAETSARAASRAEEEARYAAELEQARQIEAEERAKAEESERRIAEAKAEAEKDRERTKAAEKEAAAAERAAAQAQKERDRAEAEARKAEKNRRDADDREAAALSRAEEKARKAEARRREKEEREEAERLAKEERRAAEAAKRAAEEAKRAAEAQKKAASKPAPDTADFWSRPVKW